MGIIDDVTKHMTGGNKRWTIERLKDEVSKYKTLAQFRKNSTSAYKSALQQGVLDDITKNLERRLIYTKPMVQQIGSKYIDRSDFRKNELWAYEAAKRYGWLDDIIFNTEKK